MTPNERAIKFVDEIRAAGQPVDWDEFLGLLESNVAHEIRAALEEAAESAWLVDVGDSEEAGRAQVLCVLAIRKLAAPCS